MSSYKKLVRDKIPEIIRANGETPTTRILNDEEFTTELIKKLGEEYQEFLLDPSVEELADIQEVVLALSQAITTSDELEKVRIEKATKRGAFEKRIYLESAE